jgi:hypothetical protein
MDRVVITIHPALSDEGLLEKASTNIPFTVVAIAQPFNPTADISVSVRRVKESVAEGIRNLISRGDTAPWMTQGSLAVATSIFTRNRNGIAETDIDFDQGNVVSIRREQAEAGIRAIESINVMMLDQDIPARQSFGEIEGVMIAVGRYRNRPAIQIRSDLYGFIWCALQKSLIDQFGNEHAMSEVWEGKTIAVQGRLNYAIGGGKITFIEAFDIREIVAVPPFDLESVLDPNFTSGMDPHEYLEKLHEGQLG